MLRLYRRVTKSQRYDESPNAYTLILPNQCSAFRNPRVENLGHNIMQNIAVITSL